MKKIWRNEKTHKLLIVSEQGLGDVIHFSRYIPNIMDKADHIIFECYEELIPLMQENFDQNHVTVTKEYKGDYDAIVLIGSLPNYCDLNMIDHQPAYLKTNKTKKITLKHPQKKKIGLAWKSNIKGTDHHIKSIDLKEFMPFFRDIPAQFISLQWQGSDDIESLYLDPIIYDPMDKVENFLDTAEIIAEMDYIITIDHSIAHLSGAMGKKTFVLLHKLSDWRWGKTDKSPFYGDHLSIIRQENWDDWSQPIADLACNFSSILSHNNASIQRS